jgi:hypothetical protein
MLVKKTANSARARKTGISASGSEVVGLDFHRWTATGVVCGRGGYGELEERGNVESGG